MVLERDKIFSALFMKKYIYIARNMQTTVTDEASAAISEEYTRLHSQEMMDTDIARVFVTC